MTTQEAAAIRAFLTEDLGPLHKKWVIDNEGAAFSARNVFGLVKTLSGQRSDRPERSSVSPPEEAVRVVFHEGQDIGAAGGGNTRVLRDLGWRAAAVEYSSTGTLVARDRGIDVVQADATHLPVASSSLDMALAFDVLEHIEDDQAATAEIIRVLRPGGALLVAVPCDMSLWSEHDVASGHFRRYTRSTLTGLIEGSGLTVEDLWSWNVLLRPAVKLHRRSSSGNDVRDQGAMVNAVLGAVVRSERYLPLQRLPGVSLMMRARA